MFDWLFVAYAFLFITWFASYRFPLKVFTEKINTLLLFYIISQHQWVKYGFCAAVFHETLTLLNHPVSLNVEFIQFSLDFDIERHYYIGVYTSSDIYKVIMNLLSYINVVLVPWRRQLCWYHTFSIFFSNKCVLLKNDSKCNRSYQIQKWTYFTYI